MENDRFKFRAWNKKYKKMYLPEYEFGLMMGLEYFDLSCQLQTPDDDIERWNWGDEDFEIMQCTGLKDKNGKLIYEGDIVEYDTDLYKMFREVSYKGNLKGKELVFWDKEISAFMGRDLHRSEDSRGRYLWVMDMPENSIIIGNIYENPELLNHEEA